MKKYKLISFTELGKFKWLLHNSPGLTFPCFIYLEDSFANTEKFNLEWFNYEEVDNFPTTSFRIEPPPVLDMIPESFVQKPWGPKYNKKVNKYKYTR